MSTVTLLSSDGISFSISKDILMNSSVFRDILSLGSTASEPQCTLQESAKCLEIFVRIVEGGEVDLVKMTREECQDVLKMGEKYGFKEVKLILEREAWKIVCTQNDPMIVAKVAEALDDEAIGKLAANLMLKLNLAKCPYGPWCERITKYIKSAHACYRSTLLTCASDQSSPSSTPNRLEPQIALGVLRAARDVFFGSNLKAEILQNIEPEHKSESEQGVDSFLVTSQAALKVEMDKLSF